MNRDFTELNNQSIINQSLFVMQTEMKTIAFGRYSLLTGILCCFLSACGGGGGNGGGIPDTDPTPEVTTGDVTFTPDWGSLPASSALRFHFYPATGAVVTKDGDAAGCKATLEHGTYRVLAYNTDATGVTYEHIDSYDQATVQVTPVSTRALLVINQPSKVYALSQEGLSVEKGGAITPKATVRALVKPLKLNLSISNASTMRELKGSLNGLLPSVLLATGKPSAAAVSAAPLTNTRFDINLLSKSALVELSSLGMLDPANGSAYACELTLYITDRDGLSLTTTVDMNQAITSILAANGGVLPDDTSAEVDLELKVDENQYGLTFTATITDWVVGSDTSFELTN